MLARIVVMFADPCLTLAVRTGDLNICHDLLDLHRDVKAAVLIRRRPLTYLLVDARPQPLMVVQATALLAGV